MATPRALTVMADAPPQTVHDFANVRASNRFRVTFETNRCPVPAEYASQRLTLKAWPDRICVYHHDRLVARHFHRLLVLRRGGFFSSPLRARGYTSCSRSARLRCMPAPPSPTRPFDWASPYVLWGYALHPAQPPLGYPCPDVYSEEVPAWTLDPVRPALSERSLESLAEDVADLLAGEVGAVRWRGSFALALRILSMFDALAVSQRVGFAPHVAWQAAMARFSPAPGGALEQLVDLSWRGACALLDRIDRLAPALDLDSAPALEEFAWAVPIAPIPAWDFSAWPADAAGLAAPPAPAPGAAASAPALCGGVRSVPALVHRLLVRSRSVRELGAQVHSPVLPLSPLLGYQALAEQMLWSARIALRLAAHVRFRAAQHRAVLRGRTGFDVAVSRRRLSQLLAAVRDLAGMDADLFVGLLVEARTGRKVPSDWLVVSEYWLAQVWQLHARDALAVAWRVQASHEDHPDRVGLAPGVLP